MANIAVIGICGMSYFMRADHFHDKGETVMASSFNCECGGKGFNQAIAAARMGAGVTYLGAIGADDDGKKCVSILENEGITAKMAVKKEHTSVAFILTDKQGENQVTEYMGAQLSKEDVEGFETEIAHSDILLIQQEVLKEVNLAAVKLAQKYNKRVILNPAPASEMTKALEKYVYLVTPNEQESKAIHLTGFKHSVVTLGDKGCIIDGEAFIPSIKAKAVDTTGAGDTFSGVLGACLAEGMELYRATEYATVASGISVTKKMVINAIPYKNEIERIIENE